MDATDRFLDRMRRNPPPPLRRDRLAEARAEFDDLSGYLYPGELPPGRDECCGTLSLRIYGDLDTTPAAILFLHGGGFVVGSLASHDGLCRDLAARTGAAVVAVGYRLAPEHPWPEAIKDALAAWTWLQAHAPHRRLAVMGDSAGGSLAALLAQGRPAPQLQILLYPALDLTCAQPSHAEFAEGYGLDGDAIGFCYDAYIPADRRGDPAVSPGLHAQLSDSAPALIISAGLDALRDEARAYAARLRGAGVSVRHLEFTRAPHGFVTMPRLFPDFAASAMDAITVAIRTGRP